MSDQHRTAAATPTRSYAGALAEVRRLADHASVVVFDLDGVLREFESDVTDAIARRLGLTPAEFLELVFAHDHLVPVVTGRSTFAQWCASIRQRLVRGGVDDLRAAEGLAAWVAYRGRPLAASVAVFEELVATGRACFLFTNGTDNVPAELDQIGLGHLAAAVVNSADLGVAKPDPAAYEAAHAVIERRLRAPVQPDAIVFTDDRRDNVAGAAEFGWRAVLFRADGE